jgi:hypothetical protein
LLFGAVGCFVTTEHTLRKRLKRLAKIQPLRSYAFWCREGRSDPKSSASANSAIPATSLCYVARTHNIVASKYRACLPSGDYRDNRVTVGPAPLLFWKREPQENT